MAKITNSKDVLMLLLYAKGCKGQQCEPILGRTRLMKMVFLFNKEIRRQMNLSKVIPDSAMPDFSAYRYGPYSVHIFEDLEFLIEMGLVEAIYAGDEDKLSEEVEEYAYWQAQTDSDLEEGEQRQELFQLTDLGKEFVEKELITNLSTEQQKALDEFKHRCTAAELKALLRYVYTKYPDMTKESKIRDEVLR